MRARQSIREDRCTLRLSSTTNCPCSFRGEPPSYGLRFSRINSCILSLSDIVLVLAVSMITTVMMMMTTTLFAINLV